MFNNDWKHLWVQRLKHNTAIAAREECHINLRGTRVHVAAPYSHLFKIQANILGGCWRPKTGVWSFRASAAEIVHDLCIQIYGSANVRDHIGKL